MTKPIKIIGISPGTRYIGFALFCGSDLRDWGVKNIDGRWSKEKIKKIRMFLLSMIHQHEPVAIAIKSSHPSRTSLNLNQLVGEIKDIAGKERLRVYEYPIQELKGFFNPGKLNKRQLAELVALEYSFLFYELNKDKSNGSSYYIRMFEAVALGSLCFHQLDRHR